MRILVFYPYIPYPLNRGAYQRTFHLLKGLARRHEIDFIAPAENGEGLEHKGLFEEFCGRVEFVPFSHPRWQKLFPKRLLNPLPATAAHWTIPAVQAALDRLLAEKDYDVIHICDIVLAQFFMKRHRDIPLVSDRTRVDLFYQIMEQRRMNFSLSARLLNYENHVKLWFYERAVARRSEMEIVCGPDDADFMHRFIKPKCPVAVIPNGVDLDYFHRDAAPGPRDPKPTLLFCGAMDYNPNIDALRWYFGEIHAALRARVPELRVLIVGKDPVSEVKAYNAQPNVTVTGVVPDVRPYYARSWLQMVPLQIGGGTRLKIVESLAMGTPVVSTTMGAQGLDLRDDVDILLADTAVNFVNQTARGLQDAALRQRLEREGLETVRSRLSWVTLGEELCRIYANHPFRYSINPRGLKVTRSVPPHPCPLPQGADISGSVLETPMCLGPNSASERSPQSAIPSRPP